MSGRITGPSLRTRSGIALRAVRGSVRLGAQCRCVSVNSNVRAHLKMVANSEPVTSHFGYWPEFADGKVLRFLFEAPGTILLSVRYGDAETGRSGEVDLRFEQIARAELGELREQNVLDAMVLTGGSPIEVRLNAAYGLHGSFECEAASVVDFRRIAP